LSLFLLTTPRLIIRPLSQHDLSAIHRILDVELAEVDFGSESPMTLDQRAAWLDWTILSYQHHALLYQPPYGEHAITLRSTGDLIGAVGIVPSLGPFEQLSSFAPGGHPAPHARFTPEFGLYYAISPAFQHNGYASEAAQTLVEYAFTQLNLKRMVATTTFDNERSIRVMQRLNMRVERNPFDDPPWFQVVGIIENAG